MSPGGAACLRDGGAPVRDDRPHGEEPGQRDGPVAEDEDGAVPMVRRNLERAGLLCRPSGCVSVCARAAFLVALFSSQRRTVLINRADGAQHGACIYAATALLL